MEIATLIFILSFLAIVATLVVSVTRYMCEQKSKVVRNSYGLTKERAEQISDRTERAYKIEFPSKASVSFKDFDVKPSQKQIAETQEKWKLTIPKHATRIKNRKKRKERGKGVRGKKK